MNNMDITLVLLLIALFFLHIHFCYRAFTSNAELNTTQRFSWGMISLLMGPLGFYIFLNFLPLDRLD